MDDEAKIIADLDLGLKGLSDVLPPATAPEQDDVKSGFLLGLLSVLQHPEIVTDAPSVKPEIHDGVVAFVDVLGTSALMQKVDDKADETVANHVYMTTMGMIDEFQTSIAELKAIDERIKDMVISDSFVVAVPYTPEAISKLIEFLAKFQYNCMVLFSQVLRGAVSKGKILGSIPENRIIGSAFDKAHRTEVDIALYPRIVIDRQIFTDSALRLKEYALPIATDKDGIRYIDFIMDRDQSHIMKIIDSKCREFEHDQKLLQKWHWLKTFTEQKTNACLNCCKAKYGSIPITL